MAAIIIGMKFFLKTLKGEKTEFEVQPEDTVGTLKQKVKDAQGHDPQLQKLIAFGKIMEDLKSLTDYNLKENDQIVLMVSKPKPQSRPLEPPPFLAASVRGNLCSVLLLKRLHNCRDLRSNRQCR
jgi:UV excision repair protein RAD23